MAKQAKTRLNDTANDLMAWMVNEYGTRNWRNVLKNSKGGVSAIEAIDNQLASSGAQAPAAVMSGGTGALKERYDFGTMDGADVQATIALLKTQGRLVQLGQGRGYALVLLEATPLGDKAAITPTAPVSVSARPKKAAREDARDAQFFLTQLSIAVDGYEAKITSLQEEVRKLRADLVTAGADTWQ